MRIVVRPDDDLFRLETTLKKSGLESAGIPERRETSFLAVQAW